MAAKMVSLKMPAMTETERRELERHTDTDFSDTRYLPENISETQRGDMKFIPNGTSRQKLSNHND